ncbi:dihydrodipicolinate reductase C-terminal domain-containing protein, partial [Arthrospira platensis SPKY1]|nr:dihydrodipicolinate reductase C-terminal domain-containing protein [Arthrospira platensis SPKY1]
MNAVFALNERLAELIGDRDYHIAIRETHHIHKLDAPSGTAIKLAEGFIQHQKKLKSWQIDEYGETSDVILPIVVERKGEVNGYHEIIARSDADIIRISHEAFSREGFAIGA